MEHAVMAGAELAHPYRDLIQTLLFEYEERVIWTQVFQGLYSLG